jgi:toxin ParE1/3/4
VTAERGRRVDWTDTAARDLEEIIAFVARESPDAAERLLRTLQARAASLTASPRRGRIVPELLRFGMKTWRELVVPPYRLIYRVADTSVIVLAAFDGRRDVEDLLLERLLREP